MPKKFKRSAAETEALKKFKTPTVEAKGGVGTDMDRTRQLLALPELCDEICIETGAFVEVYVVRQGAKPGKDGRPARKDVLMHYCRPVENKP